jgi:hypothetical protein
MTLIFLGLVFLGHVALMLANRVREAIVVPGVQAVFVVAMYLMMTSLSTLMPEVVEQSALWQWFLGLS